jgi:hypothetical protein
MEDIAGQGLVRLIPTLAEIAVKATGRETSAYIYNPT